MNGNRTTVIAHCSPRPYGFDAYPDSNALLIEPNWGSTALVLTNRCDEDCLTDFLDVFKKLGSEFIYHFHCDVDAMPARNFSPYSSDISTFLVNRQSRGVRLYLKSLPPNVRSAFDVIIEQISAREKSKVRGLVSRDRGGEHYITTYPFKYDMKALKNAFKTIWGHDLLLDARLSTAEQLFFYAAEDPLYRNFHVRRAGNILTLKTAIEWMGQPENAERLAFRFVRTRLLCHLPELSVREGINLTNLVVAKIASGDAAGITETLSVLQKGALQDLPEERKSILSRWFGAKKDCSLSKTDILQISNEDGLIRSIPTMIRDYQRLRSGSWAKQRSEALDGALRAGITKIDGLNKGLDLACT